MQPFYALISPMQQGGGPVDPGYNPPGVGGPGSRPPGQGGGPVDPGYSPPWARPPVDPGYNPPGVGGPGSGGGGGSPPGVWGPTDPRPSQPIFFPRPGDPPPIGHWGPPVDPGYGVDVGTGPVRPAHPIVLPPNLPPEIPPPDGGGSPIKVEWVTGWTPLTGWVVVGIPTDPHPTPSRSR
jgi:hypothetical protein